MRSLVRSVAAALCPPPEPVEAWDRNEVATLLEVARDRGSWIADPILFAAQTGCRRGELLALEWRDVDVERGRTTIRQSFTRGQRKTTKADKVRTVELASESIEMLKRRATRGRIGHVFRNREGNPWTDYGFAGFWVRVRRRAHREAGVRKLKFHCFRHTWATFALAAGHDPAWCAAQIGDTLEVFLRRYGHVMPRQSRSLDFVSFSSPADAPPQRSAGLRATG